MHRLHATMIVFVVLTCLTGPAQALDKPVPVFQVGSPEADEIIKLTGGNRTIVGYVLDQPLVIALVPDGSTIAEFFRDRPTTCSEESADSCCEQSTGTRYYRTAESGNPWLDTRFRCDEEPVHRGITGPVPIDASLRTRILEQIQLGDAHLYVANQRGQSFLLGPVFEESQQGIELSLIKSALAATASCPSTVGACADNMNTENRLCRGSNLHLYHYRYCGSGEWGWKKSTEPCDCK